MLQCFEKHGLPLGNQDAKTALNPVRREVLYPDGYYVDQVCVVHIFVVKVAVYALGKLAKFAESIDKRRRCQRCLCLFLAQAANVSLIFRKW